MCHDLLLIMRFSTLVCEKVHKSKSEAYMVKVLSFLQRCFSPFFQYCR